MKAEPYPDQTGEAFRPPLKRSLEATLLERFKNYLCPSKIRRIYDDAGHK